MRQRITLLFALLALLLLPTFSAITQEDKLRVITSHSILADVVHNIAGDRIELETLIPVGADPHSFTPSPSDLTSVAEADLVFVNGAGFEETLLEVIEGAAEAVPIVEASACVEIIAIGATGHMHDDHEDDDHADEDEHGHEHDDDDHADEDEHGHEHEDDDHADDHEDEHGHEHEDDDHADEDHGDDHDDEHGHEHDDDDHADEDEHGHEHEDDDHADEDDHEHAHDDMDSHCDAHDAEFVEIMGDEDAHQHGPVLGRLAEIECGGHHDHGAHAHAEGGCDPHVWMDPHNVTYWTLMIRDVLSELDPGHADDYAAAAAEYIGELVALEADFILPLLETLPAEQRILITSHDSLGYLAATFDFQIISTVIAGGSTLVEPSARDVAALIDLINETGVAAIFGETTVSTSEVETIAAETGAELAIIYSGTLSDGGPAATYLDYMRYNLGTIVAALG